MRMMAPLPHRQQLRTVILGAGIAGRLVLEELRRHRQLGYRPIGFLDDDPRKQRRTIGGLPVWGSVAALPTVTRRERLQLALLAIPSASGALHRRIYQLAQTAGVAFRVIPGLYEILQRDTAADTVRPIQLEDLFRRPPMVFDVDAMRHVLSGKTILITGAAGSIGQELCRQLARFEPRQLLLFDHEENNLFETYLDLRERHPSLLCQVIVGDIRDRSRVRSVFHHHAPDILYHAAAYKHVPVMEINILEAIKTNMLGTAVLAEEAARSGTARFVLISTDKAVQPSSIMGASKRFAELIVQSAARRFPDTAYMTVRFGNVINSRGNVIERFAEQIGRGGPVTVTHAQIRRYFMTREEAAQLVMQASAWGRGGEMFILDMGSQVKIVDVARDMIRLAGLRPGTDVPITYTGIRAGEKMREALLTPQERLHSTRQRRIYTVRDQGPAWRAVSTALRAFRNVVQHEDAVQGRRLLRRYVQTYQEPHHARSAGARRRSSR